MGLYKNTAGQKWIVFAFNVTDNEPLTGDAANITGNLRLDGGAANAIDDVNPTELEDGYYAFDLSQAETNADSILIAPVSGTTNIKVIGVPGAVYTTDLTLAAINAECDTAITDAALATAASIAALNDIAATDIVSSGAITTAAGAVSNVTTVATATTLTNLPTIPANWLTAAGIAASALDGKGDWNTTTPPTAIAIADQVWDEATSGHVVAGSFGVAATDTLADTNELQVDWVDGGRLDNLLDGAASAGDPWTTALPGAYGAGTAGEILGDWKDAGRLDALLDAIPTTPMRGTDSAMLATETGSSFTAIPWAAAWDAEVQSEVNDALVALGLDHLVGVAVTGTDVVDNSIIAKLVSKEAVADWDDFDNTTDSLQAIKDLGDSAWITATGFSTIVATDIVSSGAITTSAGAVSNVTTVATTTTNSDMLTAAAILTTQMTEAYAADGVAPTLAQALFLIQQALTEVSISSTTETIKKIDGSTTAATLTLNDATSPTSKTRAT